MNEEEQKAIKWLKKILEEEKVRSDYKSLTGLYGNQDVEILLNLVEKLQEENGYLKERNRNLLNQTNRDLASQIDKNNITL